MSKELWKPSAFADNMVELLWLLLFTGGEESSENGLSGKKLMKHVIQKTKLVFKLRLLNRVVAMLAFGGILYILLTALLKPDSMRFSAGLAVIVGLLTLIYYHSFFSEYISQKKTSKALDELLSTITAAENEMAMSLEKKDETYYIMSISSIINQSLLHINEKNIALQDEIERNKRLSENISEFYRQMKSLREIDFKFDFFEYDVQYGVFIFINGLVTVIQDRDDITEITAAELFADNCISMSLHQFQHLVEISVENNEPIQFECCVAHSQKTHWLKFWGRPCDDHRRITGAITDITKEIEQRNLEKERAIRDNITGFYNRNALSEVAGKAIADCDDDEKVVFVYVGLTGYPEFQERYGMVAGNSYIRACAEVLKKIVTDTRTIVFRWWGSDFLILVKHVKSMDHFKTNCNSLINKVEKFGSEVDGIAVTFPISVGYATLRIDGETPSELIEHASFAEHEVTRGIFASPNSFNRERFEEARRASLRRSFIKDIIDRNQLTIVFQPIVSLKTGELFGFEALSRPMNPMYKNIVELIEDAEASGHYAVLEKRMVYNALDAYMLRHERFKDQYLFINTAPFATLEERDYNDIRDRYFSHMKVVFEVIERKRMEPEEINLRKSIVTKAGAKFALDDFGSGYSNHLALLALEPDIIKIDRELVKGIDGDIRKQHMLEDIISYARYRGTRVLAEGVETRGELETLCRMGIDYAQGYFLGKPIASIVEPDEKARGIIRDLGKISQLNMKHIFLIIYESFKLVDSRYADNTALTTYLVMRMASALNYHPDSVLSLIVASMLHDIGCFLPYCQCGQDSKNIPDHCIFAYHLMKEYLPYSACPETVLYHHSHPNETKRYKDVEVPKEAHVMALSNAISSMVLESPGRTPTKEAILNANELEKFDSSLVTLLEKLCEQGLMDHIASGAWFESLLNFTEALRIGKSEMESVLKTFVYAIMFRTPYTHAHARTMDTFTNLLARLTKQSWKLVENLRIATLLFNLARLVGPTDDWDSVQSFNDENRKVSKALEVVCQIVLKTGLMDIVDILLAANGEEKTSSENRSLMGKDILFGGKILKTADMFATLLEERVNRPALSFRMALDELVKHVDTPLIEIIEDCFEDFEGRIVSAKNDIAKRYQFIMQQYAQSQGILK